MQKIQKAITRAVKRGAQVSPNARDSIPQGVEVDAEAKLCFRGALCDLIMCLTNAGVSANEIEKMIIEEAESRVNA